MDETTPCECGKKMVRCGTGLVTANIGTRYERAEWRCYGCRARKPAPDIIHHPPPDPNRLKWEQANTPPVIQFDYWPS